jgi:hypothetical protein
MAAVFGVQMKTMFNDEQTTLSHALDQVISQHGRLRVMGALLLRLLRRNGSRAIILPMNDHLRRDIGLAPMQDRVDFQARFGGLIP